MGIRCACMSSLCLCYSMYVHEQKELLIFYFVGAAALRRPVVQHPLHLFFLTYLKLNIYLPY